MPKGIPTKGPDGIQYRSLAEARWADLFSQFTWKVEYEPVELENYIPDFIVPGERSLLIEVKGGVLELPGLKRYAKKVRESGWESAFLIVGAAPIFEDNRVILGLLYDGGEPEKAVLLWCDQCESYQLSTERGACRQCLSTIDYVIFAEPNDIKKMWIDIKNRYQWKPPTGRKSPTAGKPKHKKAWSAKKLAAYRQGKMPKRLLPPKN